MVLPQNPEPGMNAARAHGVRSTTRWTAWDDLCQAQRRKSRCVKRVLGLSWGRGGLGTLLGPWPFLQEKIHHTLVALPGSPLRGRAVSVSSFSEIAKQMCALGRYMFSLLSYFQRSAERTIRSCLPDLETNLLVGPRASMSLFPFFSLMDKDVSFGGI